MYAGRSPGNLGGHEKKETLGKKANAGQHYRPAGEPVEVDTHDLPVPEIGKAIPNGVYGIGGNVSPSP